MSTALDEIVWEGARRMLADALLAEVEEYVSACADQVDAAGHRLVVRNGYYAERRVGTAAGAVGVRQPWVNDKRVDEVGQRRRFASAILPAAAARCRGQCSVYATPRLGMPIIHIIGSSFG